MDKPKRRIVHGKARDLLIMQPVDFAEEEDEKPDADEKETNSLGSCCGYPTRRLLSDETSDEG